MALGELTKQIAQQAILSATDKPAPAPAPLEPAGSIILGQLGAMQKALKEDEELVIWFENSTGKVRIMEIFLPSWKLAVLSGHDADRNLTRVISPIESVQLIAKVMKVAPGAKPARVGLIAPKS